MDTVGPVSRTVADCALTLQAIAGYDPKDPYTWQTPVPDYRKALDGNIKGIRAGVMVEAFEDDLVQPEYRQLVERAIGLLAELGVELQEVSIPLSRHSAPVALSYSPHQYGSVWDKNLWDNLYQLDRATQIMFLGGALVPAWAYYKGQKIRALLRQQVLESLT